MSETTILKSLAMLKAAFPRQQLTDETIGIYELALKDVDPDLLKAAVLQHIGTSQWFPTIAELRGAAANIVISANQLPGAYDAWGELARQIRLCGRWRAPELEPMTKKALDAIGGWNWICASENLAADRARFISAYEIYAQRRANDMLALPGVTEFKERLAGGKGAVQEHIAKLAAEKSARGNGDNHGS